MNINTLVLKIISTSESIKLTLISTGFSLLIGLGLVLFIDLFMKLLKLWEIKKS